MNPTYFDAIIQNPGEIGTAGMLFFSPGNSQERRFLEKGEISLEF
jgi:hypothetical protein